MGASSTWLRMIQGGDGRDYFCSGLGTGGQPSPEGKWEAEDKAGSEPAEPASCQDEPGGPCLSFLVMQSCPWLTARVRHLVRPKRVRL